MGDIGRIASLRIGNIALASPTTTLFGDSAGVFSDNGGQWIGNIGGEILRRFVVYFDYGAKRMILEPTDAVGEKFEADMTGATLAGRDDRQHLLVDFVLAGSPASEAGVAVGDSVIAINGKAVTPETLTEWRKISRRVGDEVELTVRRAGETKTIRFRNRRLV
jgi:predicted metalloprotease with PDZ domain